MIRFEVMGRTSIAVFALVLALCAGAGPARAQQPTAFPAIKAWVHQGVWQDSTHIYPFAPVGFFQAPLEDSVVARTRTLTLRWLRDRVAESRPDFGGYRIYRMVNAPDSGKAVLLRRYSRNDTLATWHFSKVDSLSSTFRCEGCPNEASDSLATFVDADSTGRFEKVCRRVDRFGRCLSPQDSVLKLIAPPGPHDGFMTWYSITYEKRNTTDADNEDLFIPDTLDNWARCSGGVGDRNSCPNLNHKLRNLVGPFEPTPGPSADLEGVRVVPNPFRASEKWDQPGQNELHFVGLQVRCGLTTTLSGPSLKRHMRNPSRRCGLGNTGEASEAQSIVSDPAYGSCTVEKPEHGWRRGA